ncbi:hypothetical protein ACFTWH_31965 [Streptomyces sp. NPDC057011]|uniref:hypothetical protein n=1 Tax=unclassified Streptomyces TaxID=2593676 RepID=UPI003638293F
MASAVLTLSCIAGPAAGAAYAAQDPEGARAADSPIGDKCRNARDGSSKDEAAGRKGPFDRPKCIVHGLREFTADGRFTPPEGVTSVFVQAWGAGGGGGGGGGGGASFGGGGGGGAGAGGLAWCAVAVTPGQSYTVDLGSGGTAGGGGPISSPGTGGGTGGSTTFTAPDSTTLVDAGGGQGGGGGGAGNGSPGAGGDGGAGGTASCAAGGVFRQGRNGDPGNTATTNGGDGGRGAGPARDGIIELPIEPFQRSNGGGGGGGGGSTPGTQPGGAGAVGAPGYAVLWW